MSNVMPLSSPNFQTEPGSDIQLNLLQNALSRFCDTIESDTTKLDETRNLVTREVIWLYGHARFRARLITFGNNSSVGMYDVAENGDWHRLTTPRALADRLTQAQ